MKNGTLGVIGGSGIYQMSGLSKLVEHAVHTPFGAPSAPVLEGSIGDTRLLFLPRHGSGHRLNPSGVPYLANICALKMLGADQLVSLSAVGSLREEFHPGDVVMVDQYLDFTRHRDSTFFDHGVVVHVGLADPVCPALADAAARSVTKAGGKVHRGGSYVCIEGPQFSTRAESHFYRSIGASVIGMTAMPEVKLAREAELPYATLAFVTDYDCWREQEEAVSVEQVLDVLHKNATLAQESVRFLAHDLPDATRSEASRALKNAILTTKDQVSPEERQRFAWLLERYWN